MVTTNGTPFEDLSLNVFKGDASGPPLIFSHGVLRCWQDFRPLFPYFSYDWSCYAVDHRGHGESQRAPGHYLVRDYANDLVQFVDNEFDEQVVLYGHSLGAMVVAQVAAELGSKVVGLIMEDPPFETMGSRIFQSPLHSYFEGVQTVVRQSGQTEDIANELANVEIVNPQTKTKTRLGDMRNESAILFMAKSLSKMDPAVLDPIVAGEWLDGYLMEEIFASISCPALMLQADPTNGGMLIDADVQQLQSIKPNLFNVKFPNAGHLLHWSHREELLTAVTQFLISP